MNEKVLITGSAGFIGMHLCKSLLDDGCQVYGVDSINDYYDIKLKKNRLRQLYNYDKFKFKKLDISDLKSIKSVFKTFKPSKVINLAAQAGVRYSLENPHAYINSNVTGFLNILESCRYNNVEGLIYASSSSVYGANTVHPFSVSDRTDMPISIYGATKKTNELMAYSYNHLYGLKSTGLRFFTVYGPWGRPDMAMYIFTKALKENKPLPVFNGGKMHRDFTFIDDIVSGIKSSLIKNYSCEVFNLGNNKSEDLMEVISLIEKSLGKKSVIDFHKMQLGDVKKTFADIEHSKNKLNYVPKTSIKEGIPKFIEWYNSYTATL